jgi:hypothetical protein
MRVSQIFIGLMLIGTSFGVISLEADQTEDARCYGFVVPIPQGEDTTIETSKNSKVKQMINDLLRENIAVYWPKSDFFALSKTLQNNSSIEERLYKKGTFIVSFSGDIFNDALAISIICDYNQTHELESHSAIKNEAYLLMQELDIKGYKLVEPKIAQYLGNSVRYSWPVYLQIADAGGFLTFEFLLDNETSIVLKNEDFNVFMWPYLPEPATYFEQFRSLSNMDQIESIRNFVRNGGGYIGSCYGAFAASSGFPNPLTLISLRYAYNPYLPCNFPCYGLSLSDSLMWHKFTGFSKHYLTTNKVINSSHPLFFGVNETIRDFFKGPWFIWLGRNTHILSVFDDINARDEGDPDPSNLRKILVGRPNYVYTKFGNGKVIMFSSHPEFVSNIPPLFEGYEWDGDPYYGLRIIHNSLFYSTSEENVDFLASDCYNESFIELLKDKTNNLSINGTSNHEFGSIKQRVTKLSDNISLLKNITENLQSLFQPLENKSQIFAKGARLLRYTFVFCEIFDDYTNKTANAIDVLEKVIPMILEYNYSIMELIDDIKNDITWRINQSESLLSEVISIADKLKVTLLSPRYTILEKAELLHERRVLLRTFETGLKYIPQIYFEALKLLRYCWYNYEASFALMT